jgi:hypothetical protein
MQHPALMAARDSAEALSQQGSHEPRSEDLVVVVNEPVQVGVHVLEDERQRPRRGVRDAVDEPHNVVVPELLQDAHLPDDVVRDATASPVGVVLVLNNCRSSIR